mmetsp:Transcript_96027/g.271810  ORF Transcript_96027/g.271810 Transcript_96027/m.271810 type:complete len:698 (+) Transcript_96027:1096-3189(+)
MERLAVEHEAAVGLVLQLHVRLEQHVLGLLDAARLHGVGEVRLPREEQARPRHVDGGLDLVPGQDPDADAHLLEGLDALRHPLLQAVLHGRDARVLQAPLHPPLHLRERLAPGAVHDAPGRVVVGQPGGVGGVVHPLPGHDQGPEALARELVEAPPGSRRELGVEEGLHHAVGALRDAPDRALVLHYHGHALPLRGEWELVQDRELPVPGMWPPHVQVEGAAAVPALAAREGDAGLVRGLHERDLVRRRAGEAGRAGAPGRLHAVANGQAREEVEDRGEERVPVVRAAAAERVQDLPGPAGSLGELVALPAEVAQVLVGHVAPGEDHLVGRERPGLVREHEVDLPHLLYEVRGAGERLLLRHRVFHHGVNVDEKPQAELQELEGHVEADRDDVVQHDAVPEEVDDEAVARVVPDRGGEGVGRVHGDDGGEQAPDGVVQVVLHVRHLHARLDGVHAGLRVVPDVDRHAEAPHRVAEHTSARHEARLAQGGRAVDHRQRAADVRQARLRLGHPDGQVPLEEAVEVLRRVVVLLQHGIAVDLSGAAGRRGVEAAGRARRDWAGPAVVRPHRSISSNRVRAICRDKAHLPRSRIYRGVATGVAHAPSAEGRRVSLLQVGLAVQVDGRDESLVAAGGLEEQQVRGEGTIALHEDDVATLDIPPGQLLESPVRAVEPVARLRVLHVVVAPSAHVLEEVLQSRP